MKQALLCKDVLIEGFSSVAAAQARSLFTSHMLNCASQSTESSVGVEQMLLQ